MHFLSFLWLDYCLGHVKNQNSVNTLSLHVGLPQSIQSVMVNDSLWSRFNLESNQGHVMFFLSKLLSFSGTMSIVSLAALFRSSVQLHQLTDLQKRSLTACLQAPLGNLRANLYVHLAYSQDEISVVQNRCLLNPLLTAAVLPNSFS